jgi:hypothetical protein
MRRARFGETTVLRRMARSNTVRFRVPTCLNSAERSQNSRFSTAAVKGRRRIQTRGSDERKPLAPSQVHPADAIPARSFLFDRSARGNSYLDSPRSCDRCCQAVASTLPRYAQVQWHTEANLVSSASGPPVVVRRPVIVV